MSAGHGSVDQMLLLLGQALVQLILALHERGFEVMEDLDADAYRQRYRPAPRGGWAWARSA